MAKIEATNDSLKHIANIGMRRGQLLARGFAGNKHLGWFSSQSAELFGCCAKDPNILQSRALDGGLIFLQRFGKDFEPYFSAFPGLVFSKLHSFKHGR